MLIVFSMSLPLTSADSVTVGRSFAGRFCVCCATAMVTLLSKKKSPHLGRHLPTLRHHLGHDVRYRPASKLFLQGCLSGASGALQDRLDVASNRALGVRPLVMEREQRPLALDRPVHVSQR